MSPATERKTCWPPAFADHDAPGTLLGVAALGYRDQLVEVEAVAAIR
jgi:enamine deaminase RidA (YjgF/YER057c/UK114 family)